MLIRMKLWLLLWVLCSTAVRGDEVAALMRDRTAIERVYYNHRLGQKPPFEEGLHATQRREAEAVREKLLAQDPNPGGRASPRAQISPEDRTREDGSPTQTVRTPSCIRPATGGTSRFGSCLGLMLGSSCPS